MNEKTWQLVGALVLGGILFFAGGCGDDDADSAATTTTAAATESPFCAVHPQFAEDLNMALANADPSARQHQEMGRILDELAPRVAELRAAEPAELAGVVDEWVANMERYAQSGEEGLEAGEAARERMTTWVAGNC